MTSVESSYEQNGGTGSYQSEEERYAAQRLSEAAGGPPRKSNRTPKSPYQPHHRWRIGAYKHTSSILQFKGGASDPFSAAALPIDHFHQHLLPIFKHTYLYQHLRYVLPDHPDPGSQWVKNLCAHEGTVHGLYLYSYGIAARLPHGQKPQQSHVQAHKVGALTALRHGLERSEWNQNLAEINTLLAAWSFYSGQLGELWSHTQASKEIVLQLGGIYKVDPLFRAIHLIADPIVCGSTLVAPPFPSSVYECLAPENDPALKWYGLEPSMGKAPENHPNLRKLFEQHRQYHVIYRRYRADFSAMSRHPVQTWVDVRFHILKLISLETYLELYRPLHDVPQDQRAAKEIDGMLILALSYCHQFIYHHTRTRSSVRETPITFPITTIPFLHLRRHLQQILNLSGLDLISYYTSFLWALFVLACHEHIDSLRTNTVGTPDVGWAASSFKSIVRRLPNEQRNTGWLRSIFNEYLYDDALDPFLLGMF